jgi:chromosomal replication initiator protein
MAHGIIMKMSKLTGYDITLNTRKQEVVKGRQVAMWYIRNEISMTLKDIGRLFGKDHATVIHALGEVRNIIDTKDKKYLWLIEKI